MNVSVSQLLTTNLGPEKFSNSCVSSPTVQVGLERALDSLREGDTLVVWRLDRLGRSLKDLIELVGELERKGVALRSLQEAIDTTSPGGKLIFHVFGALAEFERNLIRDRTQAGLAAARTRGRQGGRPQSLDAEKRKMVVKLYREGNHTVQEVGRLVGVSKPTLYSHVRQSA